MIRTRGGHESRLRVRRQVWTFGAVAVVVIAAMALVSVRPLRLGRGDLQEIQREDLALQRVLDLRATLADLQLFAVPLFAHLSTTAATINPKDIANGAALAQKVTSRRWSRPGRCRRWAGSRMPATSQRRSRGSRSL